MMKKMSFFSGLGTKMVLAAIAVVGLTLTSCEKEEFKVNVPNLENPGISFEDGKVILSLTAISSDGKVLPYATFYNEDGTDFDASKAYDAGSTLKITAACSGYKSTTKTIVLPAQIVGTQMFSYSFILEADEMTEVDATVKVEEAQPAPDAEPIELSKVKLDGTYEVGEHTVTMEVPQATPFLTQEQKDDLLAKVEQVQAQAVVRVGGSAEDLIEAKSQLRGKILAYAGKPETKKQEVKFTVEDAEATNVIITFTSLGVKEGKITFSVILNGYSYSVEGTYTQASEYKMEGAGIATSHGHAHGDGTGAGGGTGNPGA